MARLTGTDFISLIRSTIGGPPTELITDAVILKYVNMAYRTACSLSKHPRLLGEYTVATVSGTAQYELPVGSLNDFQIRDAVDETNTNPLQSITQEHYNMLIQGNYATVLGHPVYYAITGFGTTYAQVTFYPTPDGVYTIRFFAYQYPTAIIAATSSILPEAFDDFILWKAAEMGAIMVGSPERGSLCKVMATESLGIALSITRQTADRGPLLRGFTLNGPIS